MGKGVVMALEDGRDLGIFVGRGEESREKERLAKGEVLAGAARSQGRTEGDRAKVRVMLEMELEVRWRHGQMWIERGRGGDGRESVPAPRVVLGAGLKAWCAEGFGRTAQRIGQGGNKS